MLFLKPALNQESRTKDHRTKDH